MKNIYSFLLLLLPAIVVISACEKIINVDLKDADKKYVIEGNITNGIGPHTVRITQTKKFDSDNGYSGIDNAVVTISDSENNTNTLVRTDIGVYKTESIVGIEGRTYYLSVKINGHSFIAESTMPKRVPLDSIYTKEVSFFHEHLKEFVPIFTDPKGIPNNYRIKLYSNKKYYGLFLQNDDFSDGKKNMAGIIPLKDVFSGDTIRMEMQCIDAPIYKYWLSWIQVAERNGSPANPVTNISGGALGYFSAHTTESKEIKN